MPTDQDATDALFGGLSAAPKPAAKPGADKRKEVRVRANWQARILQPDGRVIALNLFDITESGLGLVSDVGIPANSELTIALAVPALSGEPGKITSITGTIKTTHMTVRGHYIHCGAMWVQLPSASRDLINQWVQRLRQ